MKLGRYAAVVVAGLSVVLAASQAWSNGQYVLTGVSVLVGGGFVLWFARRTLRRGPHLAWADARSRIATDHAVVLWKPGCAYCERLQRDLAHDDRITWVNVHQDEDANDLVRQVNDGNEYTPTVVLADRVLRNPSADQVRAALIERHRLMEP